MTHNYRSRSRHFSEQCSRGIGCFGWTAEDFTIYLTNQLKTRNYGFFTKLMEWCCVETVGHSQQFPWSKFRLYGLQHNLFVQSAHSTLQMWWLKHGTIRYTMSSKEPVLEPPCAICIWAFTGGTNNTHVSATKRRCYGEWALVNSNIWMTPMSIWFDAGTTRGRSSLIPWGTSTFARWDLAKPRSAALR